MMCRFPIASDDGAGFRIMAWGDPPPMGDVKTRPVVYDPKHPPAKATHLGTRAGFSYGIYPLDFYKAMTG